MHRLKRTSIALALVLATLAMAHVTTAVAITSPIQAKTFQDIVNGIVNFANSLLAPLSTLMVLIAGFLYMTGGNNPEKIKTAHRVLIWALVGIGVVLISNGITLIVKSVIP